MTSFSPDRSYAQDLDAADPLAGFRDRFAWPDERLIYLDGNSLGPLPLATRARIAEVVAQAMALSGPGTGGSTCPGWLARRSAS